MGDLEDDINSHPAGPLVPRERQGFRAMFEEWSGVKRTRVRFRRAVNRWMAWATGTIAMIAGLYQLPDSFWAPIRNIFKFLFGKG